MPPARRGDNFFIYGNEAVDTVQVSADGLSGHVRDAALAVGERLREARCMAELSGHLSDGAEQLAKATGGLGHIAVDRGATPGHVHISFRPPARLVAFDAGLDPRRLEPALRFRAEQALPRQGPGDVEAPREASRASLVVDAWVDHLAAAGRLESSDQSLVWRPAIELGVRQQGAARIQGPCLMQQASAGLCVAHAAGKHEARVEMTCRELVPKKGASPELLRGPLRNAKLSAIYRYLDDSRPPLGGGAGGVARVRAEVASVEGESGLLRYEATWFGHRPFGPLGLDIRAACGMALGIRGHPTFEDRFRIGGAFGGPAERLPGFSSGGLGPYGQRVGKGGGRDYLGGLLHASTTVALKYPLKLRDDFFGLNWHFLAFGAAGALRGKDESGIGMRASAGVGVGAELPRDGFMGVTFAQPVLRSPGDRSQKLQFWITLGSLL